MADGTNLNTMSGGDKIDTEDLGTRGKIQRVKIVLGAIDVDGGDLASGNPMAVSGTFWQATQPVSGAVTANAGTNLNTSALALETGGNLAAVASAAGTVGAGTAGAKSLLVGGVFNTSPPTPTTGQQTAFQLDSNGRLIVNVGAGSSGNAAASAAGSAVPASADYGGINVGGNLRGRTGVNPSGSVYAAQTDVSSVGGATLALGQALAAASVPVVLTAAQITALTPPAITLGQAVMAASAPVVIASDQAAIPVTISGSVSVTDTAQLPAALGQAAMASSLSVCLANNQSVVPVSGTFWQATQPVSGTVSLSALPALVASVAKIGVVTTDQTTPGTTDLVHAAQQGTWNVGTVTTVTTVSAVTAITNALPAGTNILGKFTTDQTSHGTTDLVAADITKVAGSAISQGHGTAAAAIRVELPTDSTAVLAGVTTVTTVSAVTAITNALPAGTNLLGSIALAAATSGGWTPSRVKAGSGTNATNIKASAGQVGGYYLQNRAAAERVVHVYDSAGTPTAGAGTILFSIALQANQGVNVAFPAGIVFVNGIAYTITTGIADADTGACSADDVHGYILTK